MNHQTRVRDLEHEVVSVQDRNRQNVQELSIKEEELVVIKVELSSLHEKYRLKLEEVSLN